MISLLQHGDIESNPGPVYNIEKFVLGSFPHGDTRLGATAGVQCVCNSLLVFCWSKIRDCRIWQKDDLNHVLNEGNQFYKSLNTINLLSVDDLPLIAKLFNMNININFLHLETRDVTLTDGLPFLRCCVPHNIAHQFCLGSTTS